LLGLHVRQTEASCVNVSDLLVKMVDSYDDYDETHYWFVQRPRIKITKIMCTYREWGSLEWQRVKEDEVSEEQLIELTDIWWLTLWLQLLLDDCWRGGWSNYGNVIFARIGVKLHCLFFSKSRRHLQCAYVSTFQSLPFFFSNFLLIVHISTPCSSLGYKKHLMILIFKFNICVDSR
jgi:hypothetical protein